MGLDSALSFWTYQRGKIPVQSWDDTPADIETVLAAERLCRKAIIWGGNYFALPPRRCWLSWHKPDAPPSMGNVEYAWTSLDKNSRQISHSIAATNGERLGHPTQKPLRVIRWALQYAGEAATVLDAWAGSGTTGRACKDAGIACVQIEADERYAEMAATRLAQEVLAI